MSKEMIHGKNHPDPSGHPSRGGELIPRLRFPEFEGDGEWEKKRLDGICEINPSADSLPEKFVYIDLEAVEAGRLLKKNIISREGAPSRAQRLLKSGDVIFQMVRPYQKNNYFFFSNDDLNYVASTGYAQLRAFESSSYLFQYLHNDRFVDRILGKCTGSNYPAINSSDLSNVLVEVPSLPEQQKIADCLSSLDELITAEDEKLEAYRDHKKGLMQKLFPAEENHPDPSGHPSSGGELIPRLRFPEFEGDGEWEVQSLDKVVNNFIVPMRDKPKKLDGEIPWCRIEDFDGMYLSSSKSGQGVSAETVKEMNLKVYPINTLLVSCSADLGRCAITQKKIVTNQTFIGLVPNTDRVDTVYLYFLMINSRNELNVRSSGTTISYLSRDKFEKFEIPIPSLPEQQKIADCLSSLDELISAQAEKIEALKAHKKGLMQGLFPTEDNHPTPSGHPSSGGELRDPRQLIFIFIPLLWRGARRAGWSLFLRGA